MGAHAQQIARRFHRAALACLAMAAFIIPVATFGQVVHGIVSSAVGAGRVSGAVVLIVDSTLTTYARALTSDSGTFAIAPGTRGRFHLKVMRIGFRPTESAAFDLTRDTTIDVALADIPVILPTVTTRDRNDCRLHPDTTDTGVLTFALWDEARTALLAAAITQQQADYRFAKLLHVRIYDVRERALRDIALRETESHGAAPWTSLPAERIREKGYTIEDDSGTTFYAPDLDVLLSPYFTEDHCFRLTNRGAPQGDFIGLDFEPAGRPRHVEIRGTVWLDSTTKELRTVTFAFVNLPISAPDTLLGGRITFLRLTTGAWIIPSWSIRMPTPVRSGAVRKWSSGWNPRSLEASRGRWRFTADQIRVAGGDLRSVRRGETPDSVLWRRPTGAVRVRAVTPTDSGPSPASGVIVRLAGSPYGGYSSVDGHVRFEQVLPGTYLFEATTPLHDAIEAPAERTAVTVQADATLESQVTLKPLADAASEVCTDTRLGRHDSVLAGRVTFGPDDSPMPRVKVTVEWPGGAGEIRTRDDGYYRICGVPRKTLLLVRASAEQLMVTRAVTLEPEEIVRRLDLKLQP
ncbi:MAG: carboxypeptidase-like regulatory domain-containing protein [Gemmatimonadaceae bacterium]